MDIIGRPGAAPDPDDPTWRKRLTVPYAVLLRPVRGPRDLALVVERRRSGMAAWVWDGQTGSRTELPGLTAAFGTTLTPDGRWLLQLDDPEGSEVGHLYMISVEDGRSRDLTPAFPDFVVRGLDVSNDGRTAVLTTVDAAGFALWLLALDGDAEPRRIFTSENEAWYGTLSADGALAAIDTTDHNPGTRRFAVTVVDTATADVVATLTDGPVGPVRRVRFSPHAGDGRLLVDSERSGFARPCVWDPLTGGRTDIELPELSGDVLALDWDAARDRILLLHVDAGVHRLLEHHLRSGLTETLDVPPGAYAEPDVADVYPMVFSSHYAPDGTLRILRSRWDLPLHVLERRDDAVELRAVLAPAQVPPGVSLTSHMVASRDGTEVQLWVGTPSGPGPARGTILEFHGGPTLVTVDRYDPSAQAWLDEGFVYAALNYRGSTTFGRAFREGFWGSLGDRELQDIEAAVGWLTERGLAVPGALFATGASYGGFLTLLALGRLPGLFAGGLAHVALADWTSAYASMNPALQTAWRGFIGGTPETTPDRYARYSAITYVDQVRAPAWLNQGQFDTRTPASQAQRYVDALRAAGGDVVVDWFAGGHVPGGLDALAKDQGRMFELVDRRLRGLRWSDEDGAS